MGVDGGGGLVGSGKLIESRMPSNGFPDELDELERLDMVRKGTTPLRGVWYAERN